MARIASLFMAVTFGVLLVGGIIILTPTTLHRGDLDPVPCGSAALFQHEKFVDDLVAGDVGLGRTWKRDHAESLASGCDSKVEHRIALATVAGLLAVSALGVSVHAGRLRQD